MTWFGKSPLEAVVADQQASIVRMEARYDALLEKYHALASPPVPVNASPDTPVTRTASVVTQAIRDEAAGDPRLAAFLRKRAEELRHGPKEMDEDAIAQELRTWQTTETDGT